MPKNVAGRSVDGNAKPIPGAGSKSFDIYKFEGTSLFFGKSDQAHQGDSESNRPVELDRTRVFQSFAPLPSNQDADFEE